MTDEKRSAIAQDFMDRMGFTEAGSGKADCRWVAVRHGLSTNGNDHVHLAVSLVREDGTKASTHNDFTRAQTVCRDLERDHGLERLESRDRGIGERRVKPAELALAKRAGVEIEPQKLERIVRAASVASIDEGSLCAGCVGAGCSSARVSRQGAMTLWPVSRLPSDPRMLHSRFGMAGSTCPRPDVAAHA